MVQRSAPLANQLIQEIVSQISAGLLGKEDGRLPSEAELCERYEVSRATVREALSKLELAGIVIRRHGVGTFVNGVVKEQPGLISGWLDEAPAFADLIARSGHTAKTQLLSVTNTVAGEIAAHLKIQPRTAVVNIEKLFLADDTPVIYTATKIPRSFVAAGDDDDEMQPDEAYRQTTYQLLRERGNHKVHHQVSEVRAVLADEKTAGLLACQPGHALLQVEEIGYDVDQTALFYALHFFPGRRVSFRQIRRPSFTID